MSSEVRQTAVYTLAEVAAMMQASMRTVRRWVDRGEFPKPLPLPGTLRFKRGEIDAMLASGVERKEDSSHA
jgi:excisionase family DNA binding protein